MTDNKFTVHTPGEGKKSRKFKKFPRTTINSIHEDYNKVSMRGTYKKWGWDINCWERFPHASRNHICRFLHSHLGENVDKVYSEYINRIKKVSSKYNILAEADYNWKDSIFIPGETKEDEIGWCPFTIDSEKRIILNPDKNKNWHLGRW